MHKYNFKTTFSPPVFVKVGINLDLLGGKEKHALNLSKDIKMFCID